ncbi:GntR family transcriptional regulator [Streptomyces broussonetiae]|uniref:UTRA domain-containing protein n=1 Tax=Streptomyces broussonetiae TaxID=2686304 RepID=A0ABV5EF16_9ACTN
MPEAYDDQEPVRPLAIRDNRRHQWEKDRARQPEAQRRRTGVTERDTGLGSEELVFHASYRETGADPGLARLFGVPEGTALLERVYRTRCANGQTPFGLSASYLPRELIAANPALLDEAHEPWPGGTHHQLRTVGVEVDRVEERLTARPPTAGERRELELPPGAPVIVLHKISYDVRGRVVEVTRVRLPGDRTELRFTTPLERW